MSHDEAETRLLDVALTVADGSAVDWAARRAETPDDAGLLEGLRDIARVAEEHAAGEGVPPATRDIARWGTLHLLRLLGHGSFGEVWAAWDPALDREVALKLRHSGGDDSGSRRWLEEGRRLARVHHPNVLAVFGADVHEGRAGIWTESLDGVTLESWLESNGPMGAREAALVGLDLCAALAAVHAAGMVHGDLKPANVMRVGAASGDPRASGRIVLMDFGSAAERGVAPAMGTPLALAPEVLEGKVPLPSSDLYSLGVVLFRLVTHQWPVDASSLEGLRQMHARGERLSLRSARPNLPHEFVAAVERVLERDPARRFADAAEMERALTPVVALLPKRPSGAGTRWRVVGPVLALIVIALAFWLARPGRSPDRGARPVAPSASAPAPLATSPGTALPPAATVPAPLEVHATLYRAGERGAEPLEDGDRVAPGDRLFLEVQSPSLVHVYVLDEDDSSHVFVLFPLAGRGARNPISAAARRRLPGRDAGGELDWEVTSAGSRETFLIIASTAPVGAVEAAAHRLQAARPDAPVEYPALDSQTLGTVRGVGGVTRRTGGTATRTGELATLERELQGSPRDHIWTRLIVLRNPGR